MGVIKEGTVSGCLPSSTCFAVHYPGYPSSISRAIDTLGGVDGIEKVRALKSDKLELRFRPEDIYSHPASGQLHPCHNFLLKISRKNPINCLKVDSSTQSNCPEFRANSFHSGSIGNELEKADSASGSSKLAEEQVSGDMSNHIYADIVSKVEEAYHFNGMADYQHVLAVHADVACKRKRTWTEVEASNETPYVDENLMILAPPSFSLKDIPGNLVLRPSVTLSSKKKLEGVVQHRWEMEIEPCLAIDFNIKEIPRKVNWEVHIPQTSNHWKPQVALSKLFDERPVWTKRSVVEQLSNLGLKVGENMLKRLLFRVAYYFGSGPFHRFWIRKGYDPRKDPESRRYQRIDFRIPLELRFHCDALNGTKHSWEDICTFRVFPSKYHLYLQLCELSDDFIQKEISEQPKQTVCTPATGWFTSLALHTLRHRIAMRYLSVDSVRTSAVGEELLKTVSDKFEKLKRMRFQVPIIKPCDGVSQINEDEDKEEANEEDEEENEIEEDDADEDMYGYYPTHVDAEEADFTLEAGSYDENMSKNYLQELFGSFPLPDGDIINNNLQHNPESDEEYHIFEHDSDHSSDEDC